jgi:site-specific DNA-methyltransferase (adenine-specific)
MNNQFLLDDCLNVLPALPNESVDLIFADPPFNLGKEYETYKRNYPQWCHKWIKECFRVLKNTGSFYLMSVPKHLPHLVPTMNQYGTFLDLVVWKTTSLRATKRQMVRGYQPILLYAKSLQYYINPKAQSIIRSHVVPAAKRKTNPSLTIGYPGRITNLWNDIKFISAGCMASKEAILTPGTKKKAHPCQMPVALPTRAILLSSQLNDLILDPFAGIGTTAVAALRTNRQYLCVEIDPHYYQLAQKRIQKENMQITLFTN